MHYRIRRYYVQRTMSANQSVVVNANQHVTCSRNFLLQPADGGRTHAHTHMHKYAHTLRKHKQQTATCHKTFAVHCVLSKIRENRVSFVPRMLASFVVYGIIIFKALTQKIHAFTSNMQYGIDQVHESNQVQDSWL